MATKFDKDKFEKDLIDRILEIQAILSDKYGVRFTIDVSWKLADESDESPKVAG